MQKSIVYIMDFLSAQRKPELNLKVCDIADRASLQL